MKKIFIIILFLSLIIPSICLAQGPVNPTRIFWDAPNINGTPITDLSGYKIYIGTVSGVYDFKVIDMSPNLSTEYLFINDPILLDGQYFAAVTALDFAGNESIYSNEVAFEININKPGPPTNVIVE